jgi:Protein of unknown function (DUF2934)
MKGRVNGLTAWSAPALTKEAAMAQEKPRTTRARKKTDEPAATAENPKPATRKTRKPKAPVGPAPEAIAELAYFMWERGEPGGQTEHWLRAA